MDRRKRSLAVLVAVGLGFGLVFGRRTERDGGHGRVPSCAYAETCLQQILDNITTNPAGNSSVDVNTDQVAGDAHWSLTNSGGSSLQVIIEISAYATSNTLGIYDPTGGGEVTLFSGDTANDAGKKRNFTFAADGSVFTDTVNDSGVNFTSNLFGWWLLTPDGKWYSDVSKNGLADPFDHMVALPR